MKVQNGNSDQEKHNSTNTEEDHTKNKTKGDVKPKSGGKWLCVTIT